MKVLIYGGKGWIGSFFKKCFEENQIKYVLTNSRADDEKAVEQDILNNNPTHILSLIGRTHGEGINSVDYLELPGKLNENIRDNLYAPLILAFLCKKYNIHFTYIGTGCIFADEDPTQISHKDEEKPNFFGSSYSIVKGYTDRIMHLYDTTLIIRIRLPFSKKMHPRNFLTKIVSYNKICSVQNSLTNLDEMTPIIINMMKKRVIGSFNVCNKGTMSHNEILEIYKKKNPLHTWENVNKEEERVLRAKRSNTQLCVEKLYELYPTLSDIRTAITDCIENLE